MKRFAAVLALVVGFLNLYGWQAQAASAPSISGAALVPLNSTVSIFGHASPRAHVEVWFHKNGQPAGYFDRRRILIASRNGDYATTYVANADYRYFVRVSGRSSNILLTRVKFVSIVGPASAAFGAKVAISGRAYPAGAVVNVYFHKRGQPSAFYSLRRMLRSNAQGLWSTSYIQDTDYRYYATASGMSSSVVLTQVGSVRVSAPAVRPTGFPTASNTGVPRGMTLSPYSGPMTITQSGTVVDGKDIRGSLTIAASNVVIRRSRIIESDFAGIQIRGGVSGAVVQQVEINGQGDQGSANSMGVIGRATVEQSNIYGVENGVTPGSGSVVRGNFIHDLEAPGAPHYDGIQMDGGLSSILIQGNLIDISNHGQTSAVMIDNYFGPISNISVTGNLLIGGGYTIYSDAQFSGGPITGVSITNNEFVKGYWGYKSIVGNRPVWSGNVDHLTRAGI